MDKDDKEVLGRVEEYIESNKQEVKHWYQGFVHIGTPEAEKMGLIQYLTELIKEGYHIDHVNHIRTGSFSVFIEEAIIIVSRR